VVLSGGVYALAADVDYYLAGFACWFNSRILFRVPGFNRCCRKPTSVRCWMHPVLFFLVLALLGVWRTVFSFTVGGFLSDVALRLK
jgi:hypothetical protein